MIEQIKRCSKCFGDLLFIESENVYKCRFCGTIFDDPDRLLRDDLFKKAASLMLSGKFSEADSILLVILTKDHSNRKALFDRILCSARFPGTDSMIDIDKLLSFRETSVFQKIEESRSACSKDDEQFFSIVKEFFDIAVKYKVLHTKSMNLKRKAENNSATLELLHINKGGGYEMSDRDMKENKAVNGQLNQANKELSDIEREKADLFDAMKRKYLEIKTFVE